VCFFGTMEFMRMRAKALVRFEPGLRQRLHGRCRKSVAKFRTSLFEVLTLLRVSELDTRLDLQTCNSNNARLSARRRC